MELRARINFHNRKTKVVTYTYPAYTTFVVFFKIVLKSVGDQRPKYLFTASTRLFT